MSILRCERGRSASEDAPLLKDKKRYLKSIGSRRYLYRVEPGCSRDGFLPDYAAPEVLSQWSNSLFIQQSNVFSMIGAAFLLFPKLALGLSGFKTGVVILPLVRGDETDTEEKPQGRIRNTRKLR